jgi:pimeloyl-ACP methyl ester carboxylesterase
VVILPGFGNCSSDYLAPFGNVDAALATRLRARGHRCSVVDVQRKDWFKVGRMLLTRGYWNASCSTKEGYNWYLQRVKLAVDEAREATGSEQVVLVGHSAGGWLGRAFIGETQWRDDPEHSSEDLPHDAVAALVSLGTPHTPPPPDSKVKCMTGGALGYVNTMWPGACYSEQGVAYVAVGSKAVRGDKGAGRGTLAGYAFGAYTQVSGNGQDVLGDAVVPLDAALLVRV